MLAVIGTCRIKPERDEEFRSVFLDLIATIRRSEPDTLTYQLSRSRTEAHVYKVLEIYRSEAAMHAHQQAPHFIAAGPALVETFAAPPELEFLDAIEPA